MRRFPTRVHVILNRFGLFESDLLGAGGESRVYAMDKDNVLRIYRDNMLWDYIEARQRFYEELKQHDLPFTVPEIYTMNSWVGHIFTVERRMPGRDFASVLPKLRGAERAKALTSYLDAAAALKDVRFPERPYGELLISDRVQRESWREYLAARMEQVLAISRTDLEEDVPGFEDVLALIHEQLSIVDEYPAKCLVHGDYFPGNVFINDDLQISGVGDFSYATVVGDARMDLAGAVLFLETTPNYCPEDTIFLRQQVAERWGDELLSVIDFYRLYYSIFFSGCKVDDPSTYNWCAANLRAISPN